MGLLSKVFSSIRKLSNFLGLGIPDKIDSWLFPDIDQRTSLSVSRDGSNLPIPVVYGKQKVGAIKIHKYVTNAPGGATNEFLHLICVFCEGEIESIDELFFDDISENDPRWNKSGGGKFFTKSLHVGTADQLADTSAITAIPNWSANHRLRGLAYAYIRLEIDEDQTVWRGEPAVTAIVRGKKILDTRTNTTVFSSNPSMCLRDYLTNPIYGKGLPQARVVNSLFNSAANFCDQFTTVTRTFARGFYDRETGTYENLPPVIETININRFTCNLVVDTGNTVFNNVREILGTFRGILPPTYNTGPTVEDVGSPVVDIGVDDIVGNISVDSGTINDRKNRIVVRFPSELADFEYDEAFYPIDTDPIRATWLEEDGNVNLEGVFTFNGITSKAEALQAAEIIAKRSRFNLSINLVLQPEFIIYDVGQIVSVTDDTHGWIAKPFRIDRKVIVEDGLIRVTMIEHEDSIYPWSGRSYDDRQGGTNLGNPEVVEAPTNVSLSLDNTLTTTGALTWDYASNAFVRRFNVIVTKTINSDGSPVTPPSVIIDVDVFDRSYIVPTLDSGTYTFSVVAISTIGIRSPAAVLIGLLDAPAPPSSIVVNPSNFELEVLPQLSGIGLGTQFEFALGNTNTVLARGASVRFVGLIPNTLYTVFARSVNAYGVSLWVSQDATTTNDAQPIIDLIGGDIAGAILPDVLAELQDDLQVIVDASLIDYSTTTQVQNLIDSSISEVNDAVGEDIRIGIVEGVIDVFVDAENQQDIREEAFQRETQTTQLLANVNENTSQITITNQAIADETSARTTQINQLTAVVNTNESNNQAQFVTINQAVADETTARTTAINQLSASVNGNTATITTVSQALATETTTRASQVTSLEAADAAQLSLISTVQSDVAGNAAAINNVEAIVNNPTTGLSASFNLAQTANTTANGNANSITTIQNSVNDPVNGLSATFTLAGGAQTTADGAASAIAGFNTAIAGTDNQSQAELLLSSAFVPELGTSFSRAFLGVTNTAGGVSTINGILVDGATNSLDFRADTFRLTDTSGTVRLSYNNSQNVWRFSGELVAATGSFSGSLSAATGVFSGRIVNLSGTEEGLNIGTSVSNGTAATIINTDFASTATGLSVGCNGGTGLRSFSTASGFAFFASQGGYGPFTGAHIGLIKKDHPTIEQGDIVLDIKVIEIKDISNAICEMKISELPYQKSARGVFVSTKDSDNKSYSDTYDTIIFNGVGEGLINVCGENGNIEIGDLIVTSSIKGKGMKQEDDIIKSCTVAESREDVIFDNPEQVKQIAVIYKCG